MKATIFCTGSRKNGQLCGHLLGKLDYFVFEGTIEIKCPKCNTVVKFR